MRKWAKGYMVVKNQEELSNIREEWRQTFENIPPGGDPNKLKEELKPKWYELPKRVSWASVIGSQSIGARSFMGVSSRLENPPVNSMTGYGRSSTEVQRELDGYREYRRRQAESEQYPPVFLQDYLFVQLQGKPLMLARVVHDCCILDATCPRLSFTIGNAPHVVQQHAVASKHYRSFLTLLQVSILIHPSEGLVGFGVLSPRHPTLPMTPWTSGKEACS